MNARATHTRHCLPPAVAASPVARVSVSQMTRPNGITTTWSYETNRDLITQVQNGTVSTYGYVNDAIGRRTAMSRSGSAYPTSDVISYTYNDRSELTGAQSNVVSTYSYSYAYDPIGNRVTASEAGVPWTYTANNLNQYTSATENNVQLNFAYDLDGGMTYRPVDATSGWTQVWNGENRMVETYKGADRLTFKYDYMGRRVEKCVYSGNVLVSKTLFVYDGFKCVEELDGLDNNAALKRHTWQPFEAGLDVILATTDAGGTSYFLHDANKNVMLSTGITYEQYWYSPFGENLIQDKANIGYSSEVYVKEISLNYYNFRYYIPNNQSRWINRDFLDERNGSNLYSFVLNAPISNFDLLGLDYLDLNEIFPGFGNIPYAPNPYIPEPIYYPPNTADGFGFFESVFHYYFGKGRPVRIPFSTIDPQWGVSHFINPCSYDESTTINKQKTHDVYQLNSMKIAGPGRVKIELRGDLSIVKEECCKTWSFSGDIYAIDEMFDFDIRPWRERGWLKELITRLVHYSPGGKDFMMQFIGSRIINENGKCDCK